MNRNILLSLSIFLALISAVGWSMEHAFSGLTPFSKKEIKAIKSHYKIKSDQAIFSYEQGEAVANQEVYDLVRVLILHKTIQFEEINDVIDFANEIIASGLSFKDLEPRIIKYIKSGSVVFTALEKAIAREHFHQWHVEVVDRITENNDELVAKIKALNLSDSEKRRAINVYATCVASFKNDADRKMLEPEICEAIDAYKSPRHLKHPVLVREDNDIGITPHNSAYRELMTVANDVATTYNLSTFEKVVMAKCIAEQSLRFFLPSHHPIKALHKHRMLTSKSPDNAFFMRTGVCSNFSGIAYNAALELGLRDKIHLAKNGVHVYLEFEEDGQWYHAHPFNSKSQCVITKFGSNAPKRP